MGRGRSTSGGGAKPSKKGDRSKRAEPITISSDSDSDSDSGNSSDGDARDSENSDSQQDSDTNKGSRKHRKSTRDASEEESSAEDKTSSRKKTKKSKKAKKSKGRDASEEESSAEDKTSSRKKTKKSKKAKKSKGRDTSEDESSAEDKTSSRKKAKKSKKSKKSRDAAEESSAEDETSSRKNTSGKTAPKTRNAPTAVNCKFLSDAAQWRAFEKGFHAHVNNGESLDGLIKDFPSLTQAEIDAIIPDAIDELDYDDDWTHENEKDLRFDWENDPDRDNLITPPPSNPAFPRTFKIILRFLRVSPLVMISPMFHLEWDLTQKYGKGKFVTRHLSPEFCKTLGSLSTHPLFTQNYLLLVMALQYASIMSRNDWRTWSLIIPNKDRFWEILDNLVDEARGQNKDIAKIHKQARKLAKEENVSVPFFSAFMLRLETFRDKNRPKILDDGKKAIYPVGLVEVQNVRDAVDSTNVGGVNMFVSTEVFRRYSIGNQGDHEVDGPRKADLPKYMDRSHLAIRRHLAREENRARRIEAEGLTDSQKEALDSVDSEQIKSLKQQIQSLKNKSEEDQRRYRESLRNAKHETEVARQQSTAPESGAETALPKGRLYEELLASAVFNDQTDFGGGEEGTTVDGDGLGDLASGIQPAGDAVPGSYSVETLNDEQLKQWTTTSDKLRATQALGDNLQQTTPVMSSQDEPPQYQPPVPTDRMPLMDGLRAKLVESLERGESLYMLSTHLPELVSELLELPKNLPRSVFNLLRDSETTGWVMVELLHVIPRNLLLSIVRGTVAYDSYMKKAPSYGVGGSGIYVIAIGIVRRQGFLRWDEFQSLIQALEMYIRAYEIEKKGGAEDDEEKETVRKAGLIDLSYRKTATSSLHWIANDDEAERMRMVVEGFRRRAPADQQPASQYTVQIQSPMYIGCSDDLKRRLDDYCFTRQLANMNKPLALTLIRHQLHWAYAEAEILLTTLARSYYHMDGFNVAEAGGKKGDENNSESTLAVNHVFGKKYLQENLDLSLKDIEDRRQFIKNTKGILEVEQSTMSKLKSLRRAVDSMVSQAYELETKGYKKMESMTEKLVAQKQAAVERGRRLERMLMLAEKIKEAKDRNT
ncbi:hypothetical protein K4K51_010333 [Colletotrichum sp. SAR 10_75]|nr:hypothetical protein K4K51_010333 [Colletotrichum sp. SAR 10_75]